MATRATTRERAYAKALIREIGTAGALAGLAGGAIMGFYLMLYTDFWGAGFLLPLRMIGATFFGVDALIGGVGVIITGFLLHMALSVVLGVIYAMIPRRTTSSFHAMLGGIAFGVAWMLIATFGVLPLVNPVMRARIALMPLAWFLAHLLFGGVMGLVVMPLRRRFGILDV